MEQIFDFVIVGGGVCGVSCVETLSYLEPEASILLISATPLVKVAIGLRQVTKTLEEIDVEEKPFSWMQQNNMKIKVVQGEVTDVLPTEHEVKLKSGDSYRYGMLCVCTGGKPKTIAKGHPHVIGIRDTETVQDLQRRLENARRIVVVGNGGIATELVFELENVDIVWAIKDSSISATFVDAGAAEFFLQAWNSQKGTKNADVEPSKRLKYTVDSQGSNRSSTRGTIYGSALGPDWAGNVLLKGKAGHHDKMTIEYSCEVKQIFSYSEAEDHCQFRKDDPEWPVYVELTSGKFYGCDFIVSATGVTPNTEFLRTAIPAEGFAMDGGVLVNERMESCVKDLFIAGDACTTAWKPAPHWFQMRLWTQARQMGIYAAKCMQATVKQEELDMDFAFELFAHATTFFGFKVVLLGLFNGQGLGEQELLLRTTPGVEYLKVVVKDGHVHGVILIGDTDLAETFENLILNGTDVSSYGEHLLDPNIDIEDYFD